MKSFSYLKHSTEKVSFHMIMLNIVELNLFHFLEFYLEKTESGECSFICTIGCELGDQNHRYYLCVDKDGNVFLLVSIGQQFSVVPLIGPHSWGWRTPQGPCRYLS